MARGFTIFALWMALLAVGYDRLVKAGPMEAETSADTAYQSMEGGDGLPPKPCCR